MVCVFGAHASSSTEGALSGSQYQIDVEQLDCEFCQLLKKCKSYYLVSASEKKNEVSPVIHSDVWLLP